MDFRFAAIFNRGITVELLNDGCYFSGKTVSVFVNGEEVLREERNVFTLTGLQPDNDYEILVLDGEEKISHTVHTKAESVLLNVKTFGAAGDGVTDDTRTLQAAVYACPKGGTVYLPAGTYLCTPLFLRSDMTLYLEEGAVILGDPDRTHYPMLPGMIRGTDEVSEYNLSSWEGNPLTSFASLITAIDVKNLDVLGPGTIDGNAQNGDWWINAKKKHIAWRPNLVFLNHCEHVNMAALTIRNSPCWTVHPYYSDHLRFLDLTIQNPYDSPNTDGFDPESCTDVKLVGTRISVGDDCIAVKSGKIYMSMEHFKRTTGIEIRNCSLERGHGSVTVGSEIAGGVTDMHVHHCLFTQTDRGIRMKTRRGRGSRSVLDDIVFDHIIMDRVHMALTVNMFYYCDPDGHSDYVQNQDPLPVTEETPRIGTLRVKDVKCTGAEACFACVYGLPEMPVERIDLENIDVSFLPQEQRTAREPIMMDHFMKMDGKSFYLRNVKEVRLRGITVRGSADSAPELINVGAQDVERLDYQS